MVRSFNIISRKKSSSGSQGGELCVSEKAKAVLHRLRRKGPPLSAKQLDYCNEACIGRLLKAKGNHVKKAAKQLRATLAWRACLDIDYLTADEFSAELAWGNAYVAGQDEEGRPVLIVKLKPEVVSGQAQKQFIRYFVFTMEVVIACMTSSVEQCILILDAAACHKRGSSGFATVVQLLKVLGEHYPERLARCFIVDAPAMFYFLWKGISQVLDLKVREKPRFVFSKRYNSAGVQKVNSSSASAAANHLMRAARSYSSRNLWAGEDQLSDEEEDEHQDSDKFELRTPSMSRMTRTRPPLAVSCNSPPVISTSSSSSFTLYSLSSLSPSSLSPSSTSLSLSSSTSFSPSSTSLLSSSLWISAGSSSSVSSSTSASWSSTLTTSSLSSSTTSSCSASSSSTYSSSSSTSSSCLHSNNGAALLSDKVHARSLSFASVPTCRKEAVSEFRSFRADTKLRFNEDGVSRRWADLTFGPRNDELPPHHHQQHTDYSRKHKSATLFRPYYTNFLIPPYNEAAYRSRMKPPLAGLISIISRDLKYRQPSFSLHSTAMEAMLEHLHFD